MSFPESVQVEALISCGRCCCICHKFCGTKIELHHIVQKAYGGEDSLENCIPLCFDCHSDMGKADPKHPKGKHYSEDELKRHRENWFSKVAQTGYSGWDTKVYNSDRKIYREICSLFTEDIRNWLFKEDLRGSHPRYVFEPLRKFIYESETPEKEFINTELEILRGNLRSSIKAFLEHRAQHTFPETISGEDYSVTNLWVLNHRSEVPRNEQETAKLYVLFEQDASKLNDLSWDVWEKYCELIRQCRRVLDE